ncbi:MAG: hypothetical protein ACXVCN_18770 [Bdellovibrio sp.]
MEIKHRIITVLVIATASNVFAGPRASLLTTGVQTELALGSAPLAKLTPSALAEFQNFRSYARQVQNDVVEEAKSSARTRSEYEAAFTASNGLVSYMGKDRYLEVLEPKIKNDGNNTALLQQMEVDHNGKMSRSAFEIPPTFEKPTSIKLVDSGRSGGNAVNEIVAVNRTYDMPSSDGKLELKNLMVAKQLEDGKTYAMVLTTEVTTGDNVVRASILSNVIDTREIDVWYRIKNPHDLRKDLYDASAHFKLPDEIKGEVVQVNINALGTRLTFRTTEGFEYVYAIQKDSKKDPKEYNPFIFKQISRTKIPGGANSMLASFKIYPGRASANKPVRGMEVESETGLK